MQLLYVNTRVAGEPRDIREMQEVVVELAEGECEKFLAIDNASEGGGLSVVVEEEDSQ